MPWSIHDGRGQRKYLTRSETDQFLATARKQEPAVYGFCWLITATGCRISEALALTAASFDFEAKQVVIESLKKREKRIFRAIPLPSNFLDWLKKGFSKGIFGQGRLWPWSRMTGYRRIVEVMEDARIRGGCATPKGLRHAFGIRAIESGVPLNLVQRWLGHADMKTTAIYTSASGPEERAIAARTWLAQDQRHESSVADQSHPQRSARHYRAAGYPMESLSSRMLYDDIRKSIESDDFIAEKLLQKEDPSCAMIHFWLFCNGFFGEKSST